VTGRLSAYRLNIVANLFDLPNQACGPVQEQLAGSGQNHAPAVPGE
jgi:hypothetical protein